MPLWVKPSRSTRVEQARDLQLVRDAMRVRYYALPVHTPWPEVIRQWKATQ